MSRCGAWRREKRRAGRGRTDIEARLLEHVARLLRARPPQQLSEPGDRHALFIEEVEHAGECLHDRLERLALLRAQGTSAARSRRISRSWRFTSNRPSPTGILVGAHHLT